MQQKKQAKSGSIQRSKSAREHHCKGSDPAVNHDQAKQSTKHSVSQTKRSTNSTYYCPSCGSAFPMVASSASMFRVPRLQTTDSKRRRVPSKPVATLLPCRPLQPTRRLHAGNLSSLQPNSALSDPTRKRLATRGQQPQIKVEARLQSVLHT